jgi:hypothetical protein
MNQDQLNNNKHRQLRLYNSIIYTPFEILGNSFIY